MVRGSKEEARALATNRAASHEYHLLQRIEAGIVLIGTEVKSVREGRVNIKDAYARIERGEVFLHNAHINPWTHAGHENHEPLRVRKLLLHATEIRKLAKATEGAGRTIVPTRVYLKQGRVKVELAVAHGKQLHDKREASRRREHDREIARAAGSRTLD